MKATGSDLFLISSRQISSDTTGEIYYDSDRNLYAVFVDNNFVSEHNSVLDAVRSLDNTASVLNIEEVSGN